MATVRVALKEALRALRATAPGDDPTADELAAGLEAAQALILDIHEARGPLFEIDVGGAYTAGENQRLRIENGATVSITLPNSVSMFWQYDPYDYGFAPGYPGVPPQGSTGAADNIAWRAPRDGARIEIVGATQALYFYRADINTWQPATGLTFDSELPLDNRLTDAFAALLAERLLDEATTAAGPSPTLARRIARARTAMFTQPGRRHTRRIGAFL
jgi:hypothetical protein